MNIQEKLLDSSHSCNSARVQEADLTTAYGVASEHRGGADLAEVKTPDALLTPQELSGIKETAKSLQQLFFILLAGCAYAGLTIATTSHARLLTNATSSQLPLISTSIPIIQFYAVAPALLLVLHLYLHCSLQRLWEMMAVAPVISPNHQPLDKTVDLGLFHAMAHLSTKRRHAVRCSFLFHMQTILWSPTLWVVPLTLLWFWLHYLPRHDWQGSVWHVLLLVGALGSAGAFYWRAVATMHGSRVSVAYGATALVMAVVLAVVLFLSHTAIQGVSIHAVPQPKTYPTSVTTADAHARRPLIFSFAGIECCVAQLEEEQVSTKPPHWQTRYETAHAMQQAIELVAGAQLAERDLTFAHARRAFLAKADLRRATLRGADLFMAQLQGANLAQADLRETNLAWAYLQWADLSEAVLEDANLQGADLSQGARLIRANLQGAKLVHGYLTKADLSQANLQGANLSYSYLQGANLSSADGRWAVLTGADLQAVNFSDAQLDAADLSNTLLQQASFARANLAGVTFYGAHLQDAIFARADVSGATFSLAQLDQVNLSSAKAQGANFSNAALPRADLSHADLSGANLRGASVWEVNLTKTNLQGANLQHVLGLTARQVQQAEHWELACYSQEMLDRLNLEAGHNAAVRKRLEEERKPIAHECVS